VVDRELGSGLSPMQIGYFSFTKKAATEAKDRAIEKFPALNARTDFPYFRTLHSLAFHCLAVKVDFMMKPEDYREFAAQAGIQLNVVQEDDVDMAKADNPILNEINLARIRGSDLREHYNQCGLDIEWHHFEFVERSYRHYKRSKELLDFTDLLEMIVVQPERLPSLEVLIVDEAQDLSRLQWQLVESLAKKSKRVFLAGDDDQAVFTWAGADVKSFLSFEGQITVLDQSYRVPAIVHKLANRVVQQIKQRQEKEWKPRDFEGAVLTYYRFEDVPIDDGQWLIMGSTNYLLNPVHEWLRASGILFERSGVPSLSHPLLKAVQAWEKLRKGEFLYGDEIKTSTSTLAVNTSPRATELLRATRCLNTGSRIYRTASACRPMRSGTSPSPVSAKTSATTSPQSFVAEPSSQPWAGSNCPPFMAPKVGRRIMCCCSWTSHLNSPRNMQATGTTFTGCFMWE